MPYELRANRVPARIHFQVVFRSPRMSAAILIVNGRARDYAVFSGVSCLLPVSESESLLDGV
jgi:hypothetical protein